MRRAIAGIGRALVTIGLLILLFVVYQLWGTGIFTARAQERLKKDFAKAQQAYNQENPVVSTTTPDPSDTVGSSTTTTIAGPLTKPAPPTPPEGQVEGTIDIPKIGLNMQFVEGTSREDLQKGPGHYPDTPLPGTIGNAAIAGHRTTYLHPFYDVDKLVPGDKIVITTLAGKFTYEMTQQLIVKPTDIQVVANTPDPQITLTSCNPKYSAAQRIVIKGKLVPNESARPAKPRPIQPVNNTSSSLAEGLSGEAVSTGSAIFWGIVAAFVGGLWWWAFRRWRHPLTWILGVIPFLVVLFPFYVYLERALPAGY